MLLSFLESAFGEDASPALDVLVDASLVEHIRVSQDRPAVMAHPVVKMIAKARAIENGSALSAIKKLFDQLRDLFPEVMNDLSVELNPELNLLIDSVREELQTTRDRLYYGSLDDMRIYYESRGEEIPPSGLKAIDDAGRRIDKSKELLYILTGASSW